VQMDSIKTQKGQLGTNWELIGTFPVQLVHLRPQSTQIGIIVRVIVPHRYKWDIVKAIVYTIQSIIGDKSFIFNMGINSNESRVEGCGRM